MKKETDRKAIVFHVCNGNRCLEKLEKNISIDVRPLFSLKKICNVKLISELK